MAWEPSRLDIENIYKMSQYWLPEQYIADLLGVKLSDYRKVREEREDISKAESTGRAFGANRLYKTAFEIAVDKRNVNMLTFVLKAQEGWRDSDPTNVNIANFSGSLPTTEEAIKILERSQNRRLSAPVEVAPLDEDIPLPAEEEVDAV